MSKNLDFYFFIGSTYSYLSVKRAARAAAAAGVVLNWKPFSGKPAKLKCMWRDLERRARRFDIPFEGPPPYPIDLQERANHLATLAAAFTQLRLWDRSLLGRRSPGRRAGLVPGGTGTLTAPIHALMTGQKRSAMRCPMAKAARWRATLSMGKSGASLSRRMAA